MALGLLVPFPTLVVPAWNLRVVDPTGQPLPGMVVSQYWEDSSVQFNGDEENAHSDADGYVHFPRRKVWAPALWRLLFPILKVALYGAHAGFGPHSYVSGSTRRVEGSAKYEASGAPPNELVLRIRRIAN